MRRDVRLLLLLALCALVAIKLASGHQPTYGNLRLELVQVLFRHGERTPQITEAKLMANVSASFEEPWGFAQLTNRGKKQEYRLGEMLRQRYGDFLGDYRPEDVYAISSDYDRTKMSLQLVLAALYPPSDELSWNDNLDWMPVPTHFLPRELDVLFNLDICPKYQKAWRLVMNSRLMRNQLREFDDLFRLFEQYYPNSTINLERLFYLNNVLNIQMYLNLPLPDWYTPEIHDRLTVAGKMHLDTLSFTPTLVRLNGGGLARRMMENLDVEGLRKGSRKIYLYSGHEFTIYALAKAHSVTLPTTPAFGSALILEKLRDPQGRVFVKMYNWSGPTEILKPVKLPCGKYCHLDDYLTLVTPMLPSDDEMRCLYKNLKPTDLENILFTDTSAIST